MRKTTILKYTLSRIPCIPVCILMVAFMGCSKPPEDVIPPIPPELPPVNLPSGVIKTFVLDDTLIAYNKGSVAKWLVDGTNNLTVVTFNDVKVASYGVFETGPIKQSTVYTLALNTGKKISLTLKVADQVTSLLWSKSRRLKQTKAEVFIIPAGQTGAKWVDTPLTARAADIRIFFSLDGRTKTIQATSSVHVSSYDDGRFVVDTTQTPNTFTWQSIVYTIHTLDTNMLIVTYMAKQPIGPMLLTRNTYLFE